jgi:hypothetical protein
MLKKTKISMESAILALCFWGNGAYGSNLIGRDGLLELLGNGTRGSNGFGLETVRGAGNKAWRNIEMQTFLAGMLENREQLIALLKHLKDSGRICLGTKGDRRLPEAGAENEILAEVQKLIEIAKASHGRDDLLW